jgi:putative oxidoreductase
MLNRWLPPYANWANFMLRAFAGVIFCAHGCEKLFGAGLDTAAKFFEQYGMAPGATWATVLGIVELIAGVALIVGLFTRYVAVLLAVVKAARSSRCTCSMVSSFRMVLSSRLRYLPRT